MGANADDSAEGDDALDADDEGRPDGRLLNRDADDDEDCAAPPGISFKPYSFFHIGPRLGNF